MLAFAISEASLRAFEETSQAGLWRTGCVPVDVARAWHLRQRQPQEAFRLAKTFLDAPSASSPVGADGAARCHLVLAEHCWLRSEMARAYEHLRLARELTARAGGPLDVQIDSDWLEACLHGEEGDAAARLRCLDECILRATEIADGERLQVATASAALYRAMQDLDTASTAYDTPMHDMLAAAPPASAATWIHDYLHYVAFRRGDLATALQHVLKVPEFGFDSGQMRRGVIGMVNTGIAFSNLHDFDTALTWMQKAVDASRGRGWPAVDGITLSGTGGVFRQLGRHDAAIEVLSEARTVLAATTATRSYALVLQDLGDAMNGCGRHAEALTVFDELARVGDRLGHADCTVLARSGLAVALLASGRDADAQAAASSALAISRSQRLIHHEVQILTTLAQSACAARRPGGPAADDIAMNHLQQARSLCTQHPEVPVPPQLHQLLSDEYARRGLYEDAYRAAVEAADARSAYVSEVAVGKAIAAQVVHQTAQAKSEAKHQRDLNDNLLATNRTLEVLASIGKDITQHLDQRRVFGALRASARTLLGGGDLAIHLWNADDGLLHDPFATAGGMRLPVDIDGRHPSSPIAVCAREKREIGPVALTPPNAAAGSLRLVCLPMLLEERTYGVMSLLLSDAAPHAVREQLILRSLTAYGTIGLHNAGAYSELQSAMQSLAAARNQLMEQNELLDRAYQAERQTSLTDPLTKLWNRRFLLESVEADAALMQRQTTTGSVGPSAGSEHPGLAFFLVDIDHFKQVNDVHGHTAGDQVLVQVAGILSRIARNSDHVVRWGGEEFLLLARSTRMQDCHVIADRICREIAAHRFDIGSGEALSKTCSVGFAGLPFPATPRQSLDWSQVLELADQALYLAKEEGRDRWIGVRGAGVVNTEEAFDPRRIGLRQAEADRRLRISRRFELRTPASADRVPCIGPTAS